MRGRAEAQSNFVSLINTELLIPAEHPLRRIKRMVDEVLRSMTAAFEAMYSEHGRPSVPPERILKSKVLQALYSVRSDRQLMDRVTTDILFRWFLDMNLDEPVFDPTVFTHNRERLLAHEVAPLFFNRVYDIARRNQWASDDHFSADGTLIEAWGSMKSFKPKDRPPGDDDTNGYSDFRGTRRSNDTHASVTDPEARLLRKSAGTASVLCYRMHLIGENRHGLCAAVSMTTAVGHSEAQETANLVRELHGRQIRPKTMGADAGYCDEGFVGDMRALGAKAHPSAHKSRSDMGVRRGLAYKLSQKARKRIEQGFGWGKTVGGFRRVRQIGIRLADMNANIVMATRNLVMLARLEVDYGGKA